MGKMEKKSKGIEDTEHFSCILVDAAFQTSSHRETDCVYFWVFLKPLDTKPILRFAGNVSINQYINVGHLTTMLFQFH